MLADLLRRRLFVVTVHGASMEPTLADGDRLLARRTSTPRTGQVVIVEAPVRDPGWAWRRGRLAPAGTGEWIVKRVAAVGGGEVPAGTLLILGDNPAASIDSRELGFVPADRVLGVMVRRLGPLTR
jgi:signal peptidase I